jgi:hypothetical protein
MVQHSNSSHVQLPTARTSSLKVRSSDVAAAAGLSVATVFNVLTIQTVATSSSGTYERRHGSLELCPEGSCRCLSAHDG